MIAILPQCFYLSIKINALEYVKPYDNIMPFADTRLRFHRAHGAARIRGARAAVSAAG